MTKTIMLLDVVQKVRELQLSMCFGTVKVLKARFQMPCDHNG